MWSRLGSSVCTSVQKKVTSSSSSTKKKLKRRRKTNKKQFCSSSQVKRHQRNVIIVTIFFPSSGLNCALSSRVLCNIQWEEDATCDWDVCKNRLDHWLIGWRAQLITFVEVVAFYLGKNIDCEILILFSLRSLIYRKCVYWQWFLDRIGGLKPVLQLSSLCYFKQLRFILNFVSEPEKEIIGECIQGKVCRTQTQKT